MKVRESVLMPMIETRRIAVVTGANRGIGLEISRQMAQRGAIVVLTARDRQRGLNAVECLRAERLDVCFHQLDIRDRSQADSLGAYLLKTWGRLDILITRRSVLLAIAM